MNAAQFTMGDANKDGRADLIMMYAHPASQMTMEVFTAVATANGQFSNTLLGYDTGTSPPKPTGRARSPAAPPTGTRPSAPGNRPSRDANCGLRPASGGRRPASPRGQIFQIRRIRVRNRPFLCPASNTAVCSGRQAGTGCTDIHATGQQSGGPQDRIPVLR
ncbi:hypothetical protein ACFQ0M_41495 [Kitasatospora aburaviensis]